MTRNPISQLASIGEEVLGKASQNPTAARVIGSAMQLKDRVDDLSKRVRGLEAMEQRIAALEARIDELEKPKRKAPAKKAEG
jgi:cell division protein FtsB